MSKKTTYSTKDVAQLFYKQWLQTAGDDKKCVKNHITFLSETICEIMGLKEPLDKVHILEIFDKYNYPYKLKVDPIKDYYVTEVEPQEPDYCHVVMDFQGVRTLWEFSKPDKLEEFTNKVDELGYVDMEWHHPENVQRFAYLTPDDAVKMLVKHYKLSEWDDHVRH